MEKSIEYSLKASKKKFEQAIIRCSNDSAAYARNFYHDDINIYESSFIILLNQAANTIGYAKISQGGICGTYVDVRIVCKYAIESLATSVILVHNHPSGRANPSQDDINICKKLNEALKVFNIRLLDNQIITENSFFSFLDEGLM